MYLYTCISSHKFSFNSASTLIQFAQSVGIKVLAIIPVQDYRTCLVCPTRTPSSLHLTFDLAPSSQPLCTIENTSCSSMPFFGRFRSINYCFYCLSRIRFSYSSSVACSDTLSSACLASSQNFTLDFFLISAIYLLQSENKT